jgi:hypothetical protein
MQDGFHIGELVISIRGVIEMRRQKIYIAKEPGSNSKNIQIMRITLITYSNHKKESNRTFNFVLEETLSVMINTFQNSKIQFPKFT